MSDESQVSGAGEELMLVVERLSTQNQRRIVRLVELLSRVPDELRVASQRNLRHLLARESLAQDDRLEHIDRVLAGIERDLAAADAEPVGAVSLC